MQMNPFDEPMDTREQLLAATFRALREYGYAELTIQRISDEFEKSTSLVYYHYDGKDELVLDCLSYLLEEFADAVTGQDITDPRVQIETLLAWPFAEAEQRDQLEILLELRAQATHDEAYRQHFARSDRVFEDHCAEVVRAGIESGDFRECDPKAVASTLIALLNGVMLRRSTTNSTDWIDRVSAELDTYLETRLYATSAD